MKLDNFLNKFEQVFQKLTQTIDERKKEIDLLRGKFNVSQKKLLELEKKLVRFSVDIKKIEKDLAQFVVLSSEEKSKILVEHKQSFENILKQIDKIKNDINEVFEVKIKETIQKLQDSDKEIEDRFGYTIEEIRKRLEETEDKIRKQILSPVVIRRDVDVFHNNQKKGTGDKLNFYGSGVSSVNFDGSQRKFDIEITGGGGGGGVECATFVLGSGKPVSVGVNKTNVLILPRDGRFVKCFAYAKTAPDGSDLIFDINVDGTSIWNVNQNNRLKINNGQNFGSQTNFDIINFNENSLLTIDVDQVGSNFSGQDITVVLLMNLNS